MPISAKVTKNACYCVGKTSRRKQVHSHNHLAQNSLKLTGAQTVRLFCRATARPLGIRRRLCERLAVKVPTPVLHRWGKTKSLIRLAERYGYIYRIDHHIGETVLNKLFSWVICISCHDICSIENYEITLFSS